MPDALTAGEQETYMEGLFDAARSGTIEQRKLFAERRVKNWGWDYAMARPAGKAAPPTDGFGKQNDPPFVPSLSKHEFAQSNGKAETGNAKPPPDPELLLPNPSAFIPSPSQGPRYSRPARP